MKALKSRIMANNIEYLLKTRTISASAPVRVDMGGTLDISTIHYPLRCLAPVTFNIALNLRTAVRLAPFAGGRIRVTSKGVGEAEFAIDQAPFNHPLGLMFAVAAYFNVEGVHIHIESESPPKSGLGGSSAACVALAAAFSAIPEISTRRESPSRAMLAMTAHWIEQAAARVPCGVQDQLAAAFGGVHAWRWPADPLGDRYVQIPVVSQENADALEKRILAAYCGMPHESKDVNGIWVNQFLSGQYRAEWREMIRLTHEFVDALTRMDLKTAVSAMNGETAIRTRLTPAVLDEIGTRLVAAAVKNECGARFTGAGGGGCIWAVGEPEAISALKSAWTPILSERPDAGLLDAGIDFEGVSCIVE